MAQRDCPYQIAGGEHWFICGESTGRLGGAMRQESMTDAVLERNKLNKQRDALMVERRNLVKADNAKHEQAARQQALATVTADANGWFQFDGIEPGSYSLYARMNTQDYDLEWSRSITVRRNAAEVKLTADAGRGVQPPQKK